MTKELDAIMKRTRYRNKFFKDKCQTCRENYKILRNLCTELLRETKKSYYVSLNTRKSRIIESSGKLLFLFSQKRRQRVKRLFLMKQKNIHIIIKKYTLFKRCPRIKSTQHCYYFSKKKNTFCLNYHGNLCKTPQYC